MKIEPRHTLIDGWDQEKIKNTTVVIVGCGAVGSQAAVILAKIGIGKIIAIDFDTLEEHNIYNQIYSKDQIGSSKVKALQHIIEKIGETEFIGIKAWVEDAEFLQYKPDVIFGCCDSLASRFFLNFLSVSKSIPYIGAGLRGNQGNVSVVIPNKGPCLQCWPDLFEKEPLVASCSGNPIPLSYYGGSFASTLQIAELLNLLSNRQSHPMIYFDLEKGVAQSIRLERNMECKLCGTLE
jgi:adenylyltransferase/sulfurtransferase